MKFKDIFISIINPFCFPWWAVCNAQICCTSFPKKRHRFAGRVWHELYPHDSGSLRNEPRRSNWNLTGGNCSHVGDWDRDTRSRSHRSDFQLPVFRTSTQSRDISPRNHGNGSFLFPPRSGLSRTNQIRATDLHVNTRTTESELSMTLINYVKYPVSVAKYHNIDSILMQYWYGLLGILTD